MTNSGNGPREEMRNLFSFTCMTDTYLKREFLARRFKKKLIINAEELKKKSTS